MRAFLSIARHIDANVTFHFCTSEHNATSHGNEIHDVTGGEPKKRCVCVCVSPLLKLHNEQDSHALRSILPWRSFKDPEDQPSDADQSCLDGKRLELIQMGVARANVTTFSEQTT